MTPPLSTQSQPIHGLEQWVRTEPQTSLKSVKQWDAFHVLLSSGISRNDKEQPTASRKQCFDGAAQAAELCPAHAFVKPMSATF